MTYESHEVRPSGDVKREIAESYDAEERWDLGLGQKDGTLKQ